MPDAPEKLSATSIYYVRTNAILLIERNKGCDISNTIDDGWQRGRSSKAMFPEQVSVCCVECIDGMSIDLGA